MANEKFRVMTIKYSGVTRRVYLLNPGDHFERFGGSSRGLTVTKTASLIVSDTSAAGTQDTEVNVNDATAWDNIRRSMAHPGAVVSE